MSEESPNILTTEPEQSAQSLYKDIQYAAENKEHWDSMLRPSFKNMIRTALIGAELQKGSSSAHNQLNYTQRAAKQDIDDNFEYRVNEAIHDATAAGVELNLPESGMPEAAVHVVELPQQHQEK